MKRLKDIYKYLQGRYGGNVIGARAGGLRSGACRRRRDLLAGICARRRHARPGTLRARRMRGHLVVHHAAAKHAHGKVRERAHALALIVRRVRRRRLGSSRLRLRQMHPTVLNAHVLQAVVAHQRLQHGLNAGMPRLSGDLALAHFEIAPYHDNLLCLVMALHASPFRLVYPHIVAKHPQRRPGKGTHLSEKCAHTSRAGEKRVRTTAVFARTPDTVQDIPSCVVLDRAIST